jgi:hypothetical protein
MLPYPRADWSRIVPPTGTPPRRRTSIPQMVLTMLTGIAVTVGRTLQTGARRFRYALRARPVEGVALAVSLATVGIVGGLVLAVVGSSPTLSTGPLLPGTQVSPVRTPPPRRAATHTGHFRPPQAGRRAVSPVPGATYSPTTPPGVLTSGSPRPAPTSVGSQPSPSPSARPSPQPSTVGASGSPSPTPSASRSPFCLISVLGLCVL